MLGETRAPERAFRAALFLALPVHDGIAYVLPVAVGPGERPRRMDRWTTGALPEIARSIGGDWLGHAVAAGAVVSAAGLFMSLLLTNSRLPYVLARDRHAPGLARRSSIRGSARRGRRWSSRRRCYAAFAAVLVQGADRPEHVALLARAARRARPRSCDCAVSRAGDGPSMACARRSRRAPSSSSSSPRSSRSARWRRRDGRNTIAGVAAALDRADGVPLFGETHYAGRGGGGHEGAWSTARRTRGACGSARSRSRTSAKCSSSRTGSSGSGSTSRTTELLAEVQQEFSLHDLAVEDAARAHQRPKLERYGESLFVVLRTAHLDRATGEIEFGETHLFVGANYVVSVRHGPSLALRRGALALRGESGSPGQGPRLRPLRAHGLHRRPVLPAGRRASRTSWRRSRTTSSGRR